MSLIVSVLTGGSNSHQTTSEEANGVYTDFVSNGVVGSLTNTSGVAPATGGYAVNAQGTPDMTVAVSSGVAYVTGTPTSQNSQKLRVKNSASSNVTISANSSGSTKYDWLYISLSATNMANPNSAADNVATLVTSRSSSASTDDGTPPTYGTLLAVITVSNGASSITNGNIADKRLRAAPVGGINDVNGNEVVKTSATASAVNEVTVTNAATGNAPTISATGDDTNIPLKLSGKGTGAVQIYVNGVDQMGASQSYSPTISGYSANPTNAVYQYSQIGKWVFLHISEGSNGTSNSTSKTYSLPVAARTLTNASWRTLGQGVNNGSGVTVLGLVASGGTTASFFASATGAAWTASGNASISGIVLVYEAA